MTFSTPGIKAPNEEISDDTLLDTLKQVVDERTELTRKLQVPSYNCCVYVSQLLTIGSDHMNTPSAQYDENSMILGIPLLHPVLLYFCQLDIVDHVFI